LDAKINKEVIMDVKWQEVGWDSTTIERIGHDGINLYVVFKKNNSGYKYLNVPYEIYLRIMNKECISKSEGKPSYGATLSNLVKKAGFLYEQYQ
jgi:hypothetical protein